MSNYIENKPYLDFVRTLPCCNTGQWPVEAHHVIGFGSGMTGGKASHDIHAVPLAPEVHAEVHKNPKQWPQLMWVVETQEKAIKAGVLK